MLSVQAFQPLTLIYRRGNFVYNHCIGGVHQFIGNCLIPLDPCIFGPRHSPNANITSVVESIWRSVSWLCNELIFSSLTSPSCFKDWKRKIHQNHETFTKNNKIYIFLYHDRQTDGQSELTGCSLVKDIFTKIIISLS